MNVKLINSMGDDLTVVNAARVSLAKESEFLWKKHDSGVESWAVPYLSEPDKKLITYLAKHQHWTPFSHVMLTLRIKMPIFIAREWYRHTVGFTRNEVSRRYVDDAPEFFMPEYFRVRSDSVKQGSTDEEHPDNKKWVNAANAANNSAAMLYMQMIENGVPPEQARMFLPQTMMTEFYETASLAAYARLCKLRQDAHAQIEIQKYANEVATICRNVAPVAWGALMDNSHD